MADWFDTNGNAFGLHAEIEAAFGNDATYSPADGSPDRTLRGVLEQSDIDIDELTERNGYIQTEQNFRLRRAKHDISEFPRRPGQNDFGLLTTASTTWGVVGVSSDGASFVRLHLSARTS